MKTLDKIDGIDSFDCCVSLGQNSPSALKIDGTALKKCHKSDKQNLPKNEFISSNSDFLRNSHFYSTNALLEMENLRKLDLSHYISDHIRKLEDKEEDLRYKMDECLKLASNTIFNKNKFETWKLENSIRTEDLTISQQFLEIINRHRCISSEDHPSFIESPAVKDYGAISLNERIEKLCLLDETYRVTYKQILDNITSCKNKSKLIALCHTEVTKINDLNTKGNIIIEKAKLNDIHDEDLENFQILLDEMTNIAVTIKKRTTNVEEDEKLIIQDLESIIDSNEDILNKIEKTGDQDQLPITKSSLEDSVCNECLGPFMSLKTISEEFDEKVKALRDRVPSKTYRQLKISIGTPVNTLSTESSFHMRDKYSKVAQFLRCDSDMYRTAFSDLPKDSFILLVIDHLCKQFINHAVQRLRPSKTEEAFVLAAFIVALWIEFPLFGTILHANIFRECPYCIPAYWPRINDQSDKEYHTSLGYRYNNNGEIEDELSFLDRMTGIFMLYIAITVTNSRQNCQHPCGPKNSWKWLAATMNLEPRSNITATLLHTFLEIAGHKLSQLYGSQFYKIIYLMWHIYLDKIDKITSSEFRAPFSKLKIYLEKVLQFGFTQPKGILTADL